MAYSTVTEIRENLRQWRDDFETVTNADILRQQALANGIINGFVRVMYAMPLLVPYDPFLEALEVDLTTFRLLQELWLQKPKDNDKRSSMLNDLKDRLKSVLPLKVAYLGLREFVRLTHPLISTVTQDIDGSFIFTAGYGSADTFLNYQSVSEGSYDNFRTDTLYGDNPNLDSAIVRAIETGEFIT